MAALSEITLVPFSGVQFVTYSFNYDTIRGFNRHFIERPYPEEATDEGVPWKLLQGWNEDDPMGDPPHVEAGEDLGYSINRNAALEPFLNEWLPVPYLRRLPGRTIDQDVNYDKGPSNWVRVMISPDLSRRDQNGSWYNVVFAFDTAVVMEDDGTAQGAGDEDALLDPIYAAPRKYDIENPCDFHFVANMSKLDWFLSDPRPTDEDGEFQDFQIWVNEWLEELFTAHLTKKSRSGRRESEYHLEHAARWIALMQLLKEIVAPAPVRFIDTISENRNIKPVDVDLVLDVGNSRTCGMLIENYPNEDTVELNNSLVLQLRDLQKPHKVYNEPFESHVALSQAWFGKENLSRMSGRSDAFFWPTLVRVGPEATRIKSAQTGTESIIGMSAPKRYLWDVSPVNQPWRFPKTDYGDDGEMPPIGRVVRRYLNENGDVLSQVKNPRNRDLYAALYPKSRPADYSKPSLQLTYSRSAFYGFMLSEIFYQAMVMINDPAVRADRRQTDAPRRLRRIILTLPTALPVREQRIMKARAEGAISFLWDILKWNENPPPGLDRPSVHVSWDEASCVQFVWLYGEISRRFGGRIQEYFALTGRPRPRFEPDTPPPAGATPEPSLRVASLDIGGGTTDLMITTFFQDDDRAIVPIQTFREGVRIAGDDITKSIIERCIMPEIEKAMTQNGVRDARIKLRDLFNGDRANMPEQQKQARRQFVQQILVPCALGMMEAYEASGADRYQTIHYTNIAELVRNPFYDYSETLSYLMSVFNEDADMEFDLLAMKLPLDFGLMALAISETMDAVLDPISEAIAHFDCDMVLLSGRPSKLAAVQENLTNRLFIAPDRLLPMGRYPVGNWYPFRSRFSAEIGDPKSNAVMGGVLCTLAERNITNFMLYTHMLQARSTTRYIGELEADMKLLNHKVLFTFDELDREGDHSEKTLKLYTEAMLGYRQLPHERWVTSPLYHLRLEDSRPPQPIELTLSRDQVEELEEEELPDMQALELMKHEATKEDLRIVDAIDAIGAPVQKSVSITFRTFPISQGEYWLDSGILSI